MEPLMESSNLEILSLDAIAIPTPVENSIDGERFFVTSLEFWNRYTLLRFTWAVNPIHSKHRIAFIEHDMIQSEPTGATGYAQDPAVGAMANDIRFTPLVKPYPKEIRLVFDTLDETTGEVKMRRGFPMQLTYHHR